MNEMDYKDLSVKEFTKAAGVYETDQAGVYKLCKKDYPDVLAELEKEPFEKLTADRQLMSFRHTGFWQCMDTQREMKLLNQLWNEGKAPWKVW